MNGAPASGLGRSRHPHWSALAISLGVMLLASFAGWRLSSAWAHQLSVLEHADISRGAPGWTALDRTHLDWFRLSLGVTVLLLGAITYALGRRVSYLTAAVVARTRQLAESELDSRRLSAEAERARASAEATRAQIGETLERMSDGFGTLDRDFRYTYVNLHLLEFVGRRREDMMGRRLRDVFPEVVGTPVYEAYHQAMREQRPLVLDHFYPPLQRWFQYRFYPSSTGLSVFSRDITDRKHAEDTLRASESWLRELVDGVPLPMAFVRPDGVVAIINREFVRLFGYEAEEIATADAWWERAYPDPEYRSQAQRHWHGSVASIGPECRIPIMEREVVCKDGTRRHVEIGGRVMSGGVLVTFTDVTPRVAFEASIAQAQQESARLLREAEQSRRALLSLVEDQKETEAALRLHGAALEATAAAVVITDRDGRVEWANPAFTALSGWSLAEVVGRNPREFIKSDKQDQHFYRAMWDTLTAGNVWRGEIVNRRKNGTELVEEMTITPLRDADGTITRYIAVKQDMTEQKALQQHFLHGQRMEAIGTLASGIAHDLNNILTPVLMVSSLLRERLQDPEDRDLFALAENSAKRGADIVQQLLSFSRGKGGNRAIVQTRHLLKEVAKIIRETFPREITLQELVGRELWTVSADATQLHQVLLNLCVNARDAMPDGGTLTLAAGNITLQENHPGMPLNTPAGPYLCLEVGDTGTGLAPEIRHRIFDPFFTTKEIGKGTGLGLSTALGIVQNHGGFIQVDSTVGKGTTFKVYLPARVDSVLAAEVVNEVPPTAAAPASDRRTILLVDDERNVRDAARVVMEDQNYRVISAVNGEDALGLFLRNRAAINLVITDLMMPVMNGLSLIRALRAIDPKLRIVAASGLAEEDKRQELARLGVTDVLMKPYSGSTLLERVRQELAEPH